MATVEHHEGEEFMTRMLLLLEICDLSQCLGIFWAQMVEMKGVSKPNRLHFDICWGISDIKM